MIRLIEEREEDPEEEELRALKEAEEKQRRLDADETYRRAAEDRERAAAVRLAESSTDPGQSTFDASRLAQAPSMRYNVSSVQLPTTTVVNMQSSSTSKGSSGFHSHGGAGHRSTRVPATGPARGDRENDATHWRPSWQQPQMLDAMRLAPGVTLVEHGRSKASEDRREAHRMSRMDYMRLTGNGSRPPQLDRGDTQDLDWPTFPSSPLQDAVDFFCQSGASVRGTSAPAAGSSATPPQAVSPQPELLSPSRSRQMMRPFDVNHPRSESAMDGFLDRPPMASATMTSFAGTMRDPLAPPVTHRRIQRFQALGYCPHVRQRVPTMGNVRSGRPPLRGFAGAQPALGATMGHGLAIAGDEKSGFYYPAGRSDDGASLESLQMTSGSMSRPGSRSAGAARAGGKILADRDLKLRLFRNNI